MGPTDVSIQGLEEEDHRTEIKGMVEAKSKLHFILDSHTSLYKFLTTILEGSNSGLCTDKQNEA